MGTTGTSPSARFDNQTNVAIVGEFRNAGCRESILAQALPPTTYPGFINNHYATRTSTPAPTLSGDAIRVLVVDSEPASTTVIACHLRQSGFTVVTAHHGRDALDLLASQRFEVLLCDLHVSQMRGDKLQKLARRQDPDLAILVLAAIDEAAGTVRSLPDGFDDYLTKPFDLNDLVMRVWRALNNRELRRENDVQLRALEKRIAEQAGELRRTGHGSLAALINALEAKDPSTCNHSARVACTATLLARRLRPDDTALTERVRVAALLHDIGKIGVSEAVLRKCGRLTPEEREQLQRHPEVGATILAPLLDVETVEMVLSHHEHINGNGYPRQLSGDMIPLGARIIAVADAYDAMTSSRPYRNKMTIARVHEIMTAGAGAQWDAAIVAALLDLTMDDLLQERAAQPL